VDLVIGLMVPEQLEEDDYKAIELLTGLLRDKAFCRRLRKATSSSELREVLLAGTATAEPESRLVRRG
jgi:mannitol/fructose-specific phosphotransferase system IIA component (Ntr-type)